MTTPDLTPIPLSPERLAEIREHVAGISNFTLGNLADRDLLAEVDRLTAERDKLAHELDGTSLSLWEEEQENARLFLAWGSARMRARRKNEALKKLRERVAQLETTHAPRLCTCGHSRPAHTAPEPHSCFAHGQTCTCPTYRQLPPAEAWAQLDKNIRASEVHAAEQAAAVGAEGGAR
jgi:hypothetical protein